jgi:hypothetical protein
MNYKLTNEDVEYCYRLAAEGNMRLYFVVHVVFGISYLDFKNQSLRLRKQKIRDSVK